MFKMFTEPKRGNGLNESKLCYATKRLWAIVRYYDFYHKITFKQFIKDIQHFIEIYEFPWELEDYPKYATAKDWYHKYDFDSCVKCYEDYQLGHSHKEAQLLYDKRYFTDTSTDYQRLDETAKNIDNLREQGNPNVYALAKEEETYDRIFNRIQERLGRKKETYKVETENTNLNINTETITTEQVLKDNEDTITRFINRRLKETN